MKIILFLVLIFVALAAWSPWVDAAEAERAIKLQFDSNYRASKSIYSGACALKTFGNLHKVMFGYEADVTYTCEITGDGANTVTYTFYKGTLGAPAQ